MTLPTVEEIIARPARKQTASRDGWSRSWRGGQPHYFVQGAHTALCGSPAGLLRDEPFTDHALTLTPEPDGELTRGRKEACPQCAKKAALMRKAGHR